MIVSRRLCYNSQEIIQIKEAIENRFYKKSRSEVEYAQTKFSTFRQFVSKIGQATEINVDIAERGDLWCLACIGKTAFVATRGLQSGRGEK